MLGDDDLGIVAQRVFHHLELGVNWTINGTYGEAPLGSRLKFGYIKHSRKEDDCHRRGVDFCLHILMIGGVLRFM